MQDQQHLASDTSEWLNNRMKSENGVDLGLVAGSPNASGLSAFVPEPAEASFNDVAFRPVVSFPVASTI